MKTDKEQKSNSALVLIETQAQSAVAPRLSQAPPKIGTADVCNFGMEDGSQFELLPIL
jgi:hypothetical protein